MFKTLLVEDNPAFRELYKSALKDHFPSMDIAEAGDGVEALKTVASSHPSLIFMDIKLPGENGLQLNKKIKKDHPEIIVAVLTSYDYPEYREAAIKNGADYFLVKGLETSEEILTLVKKILAKKGYKPDGSEGASAKR
jgi:two-component system, response regulator YesN